MSTSDSARLWIHDPGENWPLYTNSGHTIVDGAWICKRDERRISEVAAYQLATLLGIPVPPHRFFVFEHGHAHFEYSDDVGLLSRVVDAENAKIHSILGQSPELGLKLMLLEFFSRGELPVYLKSDTHGFYAIDLEFVLPEFDRASVNEPEVFKEALDWYRNLTRASLVSCLRVMQSENLEERFESLILQIGQKHRDAFSPSFGPLSHAVKMATFYREAFQARLDEAEAFLS